jgi:formyltetrahydrofolate hydrolase
LKISFQHCHKDLLFHCNLRKTAGELEVSNHEALRDVPQPDKIEKDHVKLQNREFGQEN